MEYDESIMKFMAMEGEENRDAEWERLLSV